MTRKSIAGSLIGGIRDTQEVIDLCYKHQIYPDVEMVNAKDIDFVWEKLSKHNDTGLRYVIDIQKSLLDKEFILDKE